MLLCLCLLSSFPSLIYGERISIATQNIYNFYDDKRSAKREKVLSTKNYSKRLKRLSQHIISELDQADIIALQEVENYSVLKDLKNTLLKDHDVCYKPIILDGHKHVAINVAYLIKCDFTLKNLSQLFKNKSLKNSKNALYTRPPLYINVCRSDVCINLVNVHLRSMIGLKNAKKRQYVASKRLQQAQTLAQWINQFQQKQPSQDLIVLGDFNALNIGDKHVDVLSIIKGKETRFNETHSSDDLIEKDLYDISLQIPRSERFSYIYRKKQQSLDYILVSQSLIKRLKFSHYTAIDYDVSDHAGMFAVFNLK